MLSTFSVIFDNRRSPPLFLMDVRTAIKVPSPVLLIHQTPFMSITTFANPSCRRLCTFSRSFVVSGSSVKFPFRESRATLPCIVSLIVIDDPSELILGVLKIRPFRLSEQMIQAFSANVNVPGIMKLQGHVFQQRPVLSSDDLCDVQGAKSNHILRLFLLYVLSDVFNTLDIVQSSMGK